jgi:hypothetical protein
MESYFDASGGTDPTKVLSMSGYLVEAEKAKQLHAEWTSILYPYFKHLPERKRYFHMTRFLDRREKPYCDMNQAQRDALFRELLDSSSEVVLAAVSGNVNRAAFRSANASVRRVL